MKIKILLLLAFLSFVTVCINAQTEKELNKMYKQQMKDFKKQHGLHTIYLHTNEKGLWYYKASRVIGDNEYEYYLYDKNFNYIMTMSDYFIRHYFEYEDFFNNILPKMKAYEAQYPDISFYADRKGKWNYFETIRKTDGGTRYGIIEFDGFNELIPCKYESLTYNPGAKNGYETYSVWAFEGGWGSFSIYNYNSKSYFLCACPGEDKSEIIDLWGRILGSVPSKHCKCIGSWIFTNVQSYRHFYVKKDIRNYLYVVNDQTNTGLYTAEGKQILPDIHHTI